MNKKVLLAYLKEMGHDLRETASDDEILAALRALGTTTPVPIDFMGQVEGIKAQMEKERKSRITREINDLALNRIPSNQIQKWIDRAILDESVITDLAALPATMPGHAPIALSATEPGDEFETIKKLPTAKARLTKMKTGWERLHANATHMDRYTPGRSNPRDTTGNSYSSTLVTAFLVDGAVTQLQQRFAPLMAFTRDFTVDPMKPLATGELKYVTSPANTSNQGTLSTGASGGTPLTNQSSQAIVNGVMTNASTFESGDSNIVAVTIPVNQYTRSFHVTNAELNSGLRMENLVNMNTATFADGIMMVASSVITTSNFNNFSPASLVVSPSSFGFSNIQTLYGNLKKSPIKNLILDGEYFAKLFNTPTFFQKGVESDDDTGALKAFGWDLICQLTNWSAAGANVRGFACNPQALGAISGIPLNGPNNNGTLSVTTVKIPGPDITIAVYRWYSLNTRTEWVSYDCMFGASALDITAGQPITSS